MAARIAALLAAEPEATPERRDQIIMQAMKDQRAAVFFFDATFSVPKSVSLLHASFQVRAQQARQAGQAVEAEQWAARAQAVWDAVMAGNQAMLDYLQREAGYSRAGYHRQGLGPVRGRARLGDRLVPPAHQPRQRPAAARPQRDPEPGAARGPAGGAAGGPAGVADAGRRGAVRGQARRGARSPSGRWPSS